MLFFNNRNSRIVEMTIEIVKSEKQQKEKRERICVDVELAIKNRMIRKWSTLKTSTDKQSLEKFLSELTGMKTAMILWHQRVVGVLEKAQRHVDATKMARSGVANCNDQFDVSVTISQQHIDLFQDNITTASNVINNADGWDTLAESSSRGIFF
ncbi:uncharacterized protein LOC113550217 [Rhopalosiphum maidis]|uniref:uncharacterized protein LOC113550217 n=1 Tax=Rhopalosiphum maidis TaxID=43146 RepID=UPI000F005ACF|nr:uncharacterized protein LOC113550217 [Rhopalosiphum maidis]